MGMWSGGGSKYGSRTGSRDELTAGDALFVGLLFAVPTCGLSALIFIPIAFFKAVNDAKYAYGPQKTTYAPQKPVYSWSATSSRKPQPYRWKKAV